MIVNAKTLYIQIALKFIHEIIIAIITIIIILIIIITILIIIIIIKIMTITIVHEKLKNKNKKETWKNTTEAGRGGGNRLDSGGATWAGTLGIPTA